MNYHLPSAALYAAHLNLLGLQPPLSAPPQTMGKAVPSPKTEFESSSYEVDDCLLFLPIAPAAMPPSMMNGPKVLRHSGTGNRDGSSEIRSTSSDAELEE